MNVDRQTIGDLEVFRSRHGQASLFDAVNRTRTRIGARRLRERLANPSSDPAMIALGLQGYRFLAEHRVPFSIDPARVVEVEHYLDSNLVTLGDRGMRGGRIEAAWVALRHSDLLELSRSGVESMRSLVTSIRDLCDRIGAAGDPPPEMSAILGSLTGLLDKLRLERLWVSTRPWKVLAADHVMRVRHRGDLKRVLKLVGDLDVLFSGAALADEGYAIPELASTADSLRVEGENLWHPFIEERVENSVSLSHQRSLIFLTGPNMAGKTTYLRSVAICVYLAHCAIPVPARRFRFAPLDALFVTLSPEDNLHEGLSYFKAELLRVREMLEAVAAGSRVLAIFDEVFRGTNVHEAREASHAVISGCAGASRCGFIFSSHLSELAGPLGELESVDLRHFAGEVRDGVPIFDYRLRSGASDQRLALHLFREEGLDTLLERIAGDES